MVKETIPSKKQNQASLKEHTIVLVFALSHCHALKNHHQHTIRPVSQVIHTPSYNINCEHAQ